MCCGEHRGWCEHVYYKVFTIDGACGGNVNGIVSLGNSVAINQRSGKIIMQVSSDYCRTKFSL
jgi:hypothetical protein